jgi:hypothetical protein
MMKDITIPPIKFDAKRRVFHDKLTQLSGSAPHVSGGGIKISHNLSGAIGNPRGVAQPLVKSEWELIDDGWSEHTKPFPPSHQLNDRLGKDLSQDCRVKYIKLELKKPICNAFALAIDIPKNPAIENLWLTSTEEFKRVVSVILGIGHDQFRRSHITTAMKNDGVKAASIAKVLDFLVDHGALTYKETENTGTGRPPLPTYQVLWGQSDFFPQRPK